MKSEIAKSAFNIPYPNPHGYHGKHFVGEKRDNGFSRDLVPPQPYGSPHGHIQFGTQQNGETNNDSGGDQFPAGAHLPVSEEQHSEAQIAANSDSNGSQHSESNSDSQPQPNSNAFSSATSVAIAGPGGIARASANGVALVS